MKFAFIPLSLLFCVSAFASDKQPSDLELGVLSCIERNTRFNSENNSTEKARLVNTMFRKLGVKEQYQHSLHAGSYQVYSPSSSGAYFKAYSSCNAYLYQVDPGGKKYAVQAEEKDSIASN